MTAYTSEKVANTPSVHPPNPEGRSVVLGVWCEALVSGFGGVSGACNCFGGVSGVISVTSHVAKGKGKSEKEGKRKKNSKTKENGALAARKGVTGGLHAEAAAMPPTLFRGETRKETDEI
eukprot:Hpha_TRINITY_DN16911_c5_g2::TRINITY_DN16911_c5_g2_i3::g.52387::m.52387